MHLFLRILSGARSVCEEHAFVKQGKVEAIKEQGRAQLTHGA